MFILRALEVHGTKYEYDRVRYVDPETPVQIYCVRHNEYFWQRPRIHLVRGGCPRCTHIS